jgi:hypothetical protein
MLRQQFMEKEVKLKKLFKQAELVIKYIKAYIYLDLGTPYKNFSTWLSQKKYSISVVRVYSKKRMDMLVM